MMFRPHSSKSAAQYTPLFSFADEFLNFSYASSKLFNFLCCKCNDTFLNAKKIVQLNSTCKLHLH